MGKRLSFTDMIVSTAEHKAAAAQSRSSPRGTEEKPKEAILAACQAIADDLKKDGFSFRKSGPALKRVSGDITQRIWFQSDRNNVAGRRAAVWIHGAVSSDELAKWRRAHPMPWGGDEGPDAGSVTGGQIGNLLMEPRWMEWDFAAKAARSREVADAVAAIRGIILPFFSLFGEPGPAVDRLIHRPALPPDSLLQYAFVLVGREAAEIAGKAYLERNRPFGRAATLRWRRSASTAFRDTAARPAAIWPPWRPRWNSTSLHVNSGDVRLRPVADIPLSDGFRSIADVAPLG